MRPPIDSGTILITGACSGLGRELVRLLSRRARTLVLVSPWPERLEALRVEMEAHHPTLGIILLPADVSQPHEVDRVLAELAEHFINVDVLVNAAGAGERALFAAQSWEDIERTLQVNVVAPLLLTHRLLRPMLARGRGGILHIGSGAAQLFLPGSAIAAATRRCLDGFLESLRLEVEGTGVVITQAAPGPLMDSKPVGEAGPPGPAPFFRISVERCAREVLASFERAEPLVYPGWGHRWLMVLLPVLPRGVRRALGRLAAGDLRERSEAVPPALVEGERVLRGGVPAPA